MADDTFDLTKAYIEHNPQTIDNIGFIITHDPITGRRAANNIFVAGKERWIVDHLLMDGHFKQTYLVEKSDTKERGVLAITKSPVPQKTAEFGVVERLNEMQIKGTSEILGLYYLNTGQKAILYRYYNGGDLYHMINKGTLTDEDRKMIADQLIRGTAELHRNGIFHRDIKPANVLLQLDYEGNVTDAVLSDFGEGTTVDKPESIRNIEHYHSAPEGNSLMEKYRSELTEWYQIESERKQLEEKREQKSDAFKAREKVADENVGPLADALKQITTSSTYDSWELGLTLWCLFANKTNDGFTWKSAVENSEYGKIANFKKQFIKSNPCKNIPEPYRDIITGLLNYEREKRLTVEQASLLLE